MKCFYWFVYPLTIEVSTINPSQHTYKQLRWLWGTTLHGFYMVFTMFAHQLRLIRHDNAKIVKPDPFNFSGRPISPMTTDSQKSQHSTPFASDPSARRLHGKNASCLCYPRDPKKTKSQDIVKFDNICLKSISEILPQHILVAMDRLSSTSHGSGAKWWPNSKTNSKQSQYFTQQTMPVQILEKWIFQLYTIYI